MFSLWWGLATLLITGFFITLICKRFNEEKRYKNAVENTVPSPIEGEPFCGALYLCAAVVYCVGDVTLAVRQMKSVFGSEYDTDWNVLCRAASSAKGLNGDLVTECLASAIKKAITTGNVKPTFLKEVFAVLDSAEFAWDSKNKGEKPSKYLAELLNYKYISDELNAAYKVLGLDSNSSLKEVKAAHRKLAARYHPDRYKSLANASNLTGIQMDNFVRIQTAYETILNQYE